MVTSAIGTPGTARPDRRREAGYNLVMLMVIVTVLNIAVAAALPVWSTMMKREREEELIFRGLQYAEAIRLFQQRFGRLPVRLEELLEVEPRCIRKLWKDPITDSMDWGLVVAAGAGRQAAVGQGRPGQQQPPQPQQLQPPQEQGGLGLEPAGEGAAGSPQLPKGPILGVYSRSTDEALKVFFGRDSYDQWQFTVQLVSQPGAGAGPGSGGHVGAASPGAVGQLPRFNVKWLGRPFRQGLEGPTAGAPPGGSGLPASGLETTPVGGNPAPGKG